MTLGNITMNKASGGHRIPAKLHTHTHTAHPPMHCEHTHNSCIVHTLVHMQMTPSLPTPSHPWAHSRGQPASLLPPVPSPRPGGFSVPLPGRHMWFQLAAERAFPSQTSGPCQALAPRAPTRGVHALPPKGAMGNNDSLICYSEVLKQEVIHP